MYLFLILTNSVCFDSGKPDVLTSQFRLSYSMILSLLRVEKISVEGMMTHSFKEVYFFNFYNNY